MKARNRYLLILVLVWGPCLLAGVAGYALILRPQQGCRKDLEAKLAVCKKQYAWALQAAREQSQGHLARQVEDLNHRIGDFVLHEEGTSNLAFQIGALADEAHLESFGMRPANRSRAETHAASEHLVEKRLDLGFAGSFPHFATFLNALERHHPIVLVQSLAINRPTEKGAQPRASMELAVLVEKTAGSSGEGK